MEGLNDLCSSSHSLARIQLFGREGVWPIVFLIGHSLNAFLCCIWVLRQTRWKPLDGGWENRFWKLSVFLLLRDIIPIFLLQRTLPDPTQLSSSFSALYFSSLQLSLAGFKIIVVFVFVFGVPVQVSPSPLPLRRLRHDQLGRDRGEESFGGGKYSRRSSLSSALLRNWDPQSTWEQTRRSAAQRRKGRMWSSKRGGEKGEVSQYTSCLSQKLVLISGWKS